MARLSGDPGVGRWLRFAVGFRLPPENRDWVRHELTDAGWRGRTVLRHLAVILPICAVVAVLLLVLLPAFRLAGGGHGRPDPVRKRVQRGRVCR